MVAVIQPCTCIEVIASVKEQLDKIISDLQTSMGRDTPESAKASETVGGTPGYAMIGTGMMGREHIRAILQLKQACIVGIFDEDAGSVKRALREFTQLGHEAPAVYTGLDHLTNDERVDAILICTPNFTHRQVFDAVKRTGKPIFLEKPMATTLEDAIYLAEASLSYPSSILLGMQYRYKSQYQLALSAQSL
jgi:myo-inositol 2-dehydrogenase/D-chiro-inositol 1-dehydrogenase